MSTRVVSSEKYFTVTIKSGTSLSESFDCRGYRLAKIYMPDAWDDAAMTFEENPVPGTANYGPLKCDGVEVSESVSAGDRVAIGDNALPLSGLGFLKLRSGTESSPVPQTADRVIGVRLVGG